MAKTHTFSVSTSDTAIVTQVATKSVTIMEDSSVASWPTTDYKLKAPKTTDNPIQRPAGTSFSFISPVGYYPAGYTVGYVSTVSGTTTFQQFEDGL